MRTMAARAAFFALGILGAQASLAETGATTNSRFNLQQPVTHIAEQIYNMHTFMLIICLLIFIAVFGVMFYSVYAHRKSKGAVAAQFHENTTVEIAWTIVPVLILLGMAWPATKTVLAMKDTSNSDITIKATGYQWKWSYDYIKGEGAGIHFFSTLSTPRAQIDRGEWKGDNYLLEVDNPLVVPVGKKVRILTTAQDVIHSWWVPAFGVKQDAIPGFIRDTWFRADREGIFRGNCAELCGKDHGFMPIEVHVLSESKYREWVAGQMAAAGAAASAPIAAPAQVQAAALPASVYFDSSKDRLDDAGKAAIRVAADWLAANADARVTITGYTDKTGRLDKNQELAKNRAVAVRDTLVADGVAENRIVMQPPALVTEGGDGRAGRRVEIKTAQ
ncbi:cytochrome c oxidase subunit II [Uliginosibacterium sp. sgz301328]|uniref:cytochrome c oxidase subunit II n=1 Tax=Uliginosibacterium sp. sgz301328 TaxID=3243764 RepID=UPI00359DFD54